ncbi:hypothetical protein F0344_25705 [Streptomyces finlayi]|uniref:Uncharacterized protein n=1 Tax=Streptomyces finlayi TaxID=67296 RepID=A0A7G7BQC5_9ACTN|nr:hypothetical protein [Streptomyces finlayi]QNE77540.1 hypothetical protein F0344_25705 [Streptomyces finlayi]
MFMITATLAADSSTPTGALIVIAVLGIAAVCYGGRWAFDVRGAVNLTMKRRRAAIELKAQQTGNLGLADTDIVRPLFFRLIGSVIAVGGLALLLLAAALATT